MVQPKQRRRRLGILIAQALNQLDRKGPLKGVAQNLKRRFRRFCFAPAGAQQPVRQPIGFLPRRSAPDDTLGGAPQIFHQNDSQCDRDSPEFTDRQWLHALVACRTCQALRIEPAVGMRDKGPGDAENPGIAFQWSVGKLRQLMVEAAREVVADFADLLLDYMKVVDQPVGRGRDPAFLADCGGDDAIRSSKKRPFSRSRVAKRRPVVGQVVTGCAAAKLSACCSRRRCRTIPRGSAHRRLRRKPRAAPSERAGTQTSHLPRSFVNSPTADRSMVYWSFHLTPERTLHVRSSWRT